MRGVMPEKTGKKLNEEWTVNASHALYDKNGRWYHCLKYFPAAFFDDCGYIWFQTEQNYRECSYLDINDETNIVHVKGTISDIPEYVNMKYETGYSDGGWVYIMKNSGYSNLVKIGYTKQTPEDRKKQLESSQPEPMSLVFSKYVRDPKYVEKEVHRYCDIFGCRINRGAGTEFFELEDGKAIELVKKVILNYEKDFEEKEK